MSDDKNIKLINETTILFNDEIDGESATLLNSLIIEAETNSQWACVKYGIPAPPIRLKINSRGGTVYDAISVVDTITSTRCVDVITEINGFCASSAVLISVSGNKRLMSSNSIMVWHPMSWGAWGTKEYMEDRSEESKKLDNICKKIILNNSNLSKKQLKKMGKRETSLTAMDCLKYGLVDEII